MKIISLLLAFTTIAFTSQAQGTWTRKTDFAGAARWAATGFSIGGKGYFGTGTDQSGYVKDFWEYDPVTDVWTQKADFGGLGRQGAASFSIGTKGYIGLGYPPDGSEDTFVDFWEYDLGKNSWTQKADFGGITRRFAVGFSINGKGYIGTGVTGFCCSRSSLKDFWEYDPLTNLWTQKADFGGDARGYAAGFSIGSKGYIGTGVNLTGNSGPLYKDFWEYNPATNTWIQRADFGGSARSIAAGFSIGNSGFIGTGNDGTVDKKDFWEYVPGTNSWTQKDDYGGGPLSYITGFSIGTKGYMCTGAPNNSGSSVKYLWEYNSECTGLTVYKDADRDGYGNLNKPLFLADCIVPTGYVLDSTDCNDANASIHPNAKEICNGMDENCNGLIDEISGLSTTNITARTASFNWNKLSGSIFYIVKYGLLNSEVKSWSRAGATSSVVSITVSGLVPNSWYVWEIRSNCAGINTAFSGPVKFKTAAALTGNEQNNASVKAIIKDIVVYPNPSGGKITVSLTLATQQLIFIRVFDVVGKEVYSSNAGIVSGVFSKQLDLGKLSSGTYFLKVIHNGEAEMMKIMLKK